MTGIKRKGLMFILSSPSGAGKTTLSRMLLEKDNNLEMSISVTTRPKRPNEKEGKDYYFIDEKRYAQMIEANELLESAEVFGHFYGTPEESVQANLEQGKDVLFDIDWQGTEQITEHCRTDVVSVFILPPSMQELEDRLNKRGQDSPEVVTQRMSKAGHEIMHWTSYDYVLVNDNLERSLEDVYSILRAERKKRTRQQGLSHFIRTLIE